MIMSTQPQDPSGPRDPSDSAIPEDPSDHQNSEDPRDPLGLAADAPLLAAWLDWMRRAQAGQLSPMTTPGHKQRLDLVGAVVAGDAPLYGALDSIKHADHVLADAQARAAALWGADWCRFSVAGSTHGNQTFCLAIGQPGQEVIITRTLHRSLLLGMVMAGLTPVWVRPEIDPRSGLPAAVAVQTVRDALAAHPGACGVILGDPSYVGTTGDLAGHAQAAHEAGVPLIVDAAWAAYLGFHPDLPRHAIAAGADAMVTSAHKTLPAYTQGALVLARTERLDVARPSMPPTRRARPGPSWRASTPPGRCWPGTGIGCAPGCLTAWPRPARGCARCLVSTCSTARAWTRPSSSCCWPVPGRTAAWSRPT
jgi:lysine decarboxylase